MNSHDKHDQVSQPHQNGKSASAAHDARYIKLSASYTWDHTWSNDPDDLDLYGAFGADIPNLSNDFKIRGLKPIIKDGKTDLFLLIDADNIYYLWDIWDSHLLQVPDEWTSGENLQEIEDKVETIIGNIYWVLEESTKVYRTRG